MKRGDIVTVAFRGDYGKPRPAVVIQSDRLSGTESIILCPFTSDLRDAPIYRIDVKPTQENGLHVPSQLMIDKIAGTPRHKIGPILGKLDTDKMESLTEALALAIGLVD